MKGSVSLGSNLSVNLWARAGGTVSVLDFANLANSISRRSYTCAGSSVSVPVRATVSGVVSVSDGASIGSALFARVVVCLGSSQSAFETVRLGGRLSLLSILREEDLLGHDGSNNRDNDA